MCGLRRVTWRQVRAQPFCELLRNEEGELLQVELQAVLSRLSELIDWRELRDSERWQIGWK